MNKVRAPERSASGEIFMRYAAIFVFLTLAGCHIDTVPQSAITPSAMTETYVRIGLYYQQHNKLPASLDMLPVRENYQNRTADVWGRPLRYTVDSESTFSLSSLGRDGMSGGAGEDADLVQKYRVVNGEIEEVP
jgi:hypothetical protein